MSQTAQENNKQNLALDDGRRVKVLSPGMMVFKRFIRNRLAIAGIFYLFYKLNDKDVQIMAKCNSGEITREEAEKLLSRKY